MLFSCFFPVFIGQSVLNACIFQNTPDERFDRSISFLIFTVTGINIASAGIKPLILRQNFYVWKPSVQDAFGAEIFGKCGKAFIIEDINNGFPFVIFKRILLPGFLIHPRLRIKPAVSVYQKSVSIDLSVCDHIRNTGLGISGTSYECNRLRLDFFCVSGLAVCSGLCGLFAASRKRKNQHHHC